MTVMIGIDPHKASHVAVAIDGDEQAIGRVAVTADRGQTQRLLAWAELLGAQRTWAIESAGGLGKLLSQELVAAGEHVVDVPPTLSARVRLLGSSNTTKNDSNDALSTAVAGLRHCGLRVVRGDDHTMVLRLLVGRYDDLVAGRTHAACRLHAVLRELVAGGAPRRLSADRAAKLLRAVRPVDSVGIERKRLAGELLSDVRRFDRDLVAIKDRIGDEVHQSGSSLLELHGVGPIVAGLVLAHVGDPARFTTRAPVRRVQRHRADRGVEWTPCTSSPQSAREPQAQPCDTSHRGHSDRARHTRPRLLRPQDRRGQDEEGSAACVEATDQRRGLASTPGRSHHPMRTGFGRTLRNDC
jgi:transposase